MRILYLGSYWRKDNDMVWHMGLALEKLGHGVRAINIENCQSFVETDGQYDSGTTTPSWLRMKELEGTLEMVNPDLIVCNAGGLSFRPDDAAALRKRCKLLGVALSDPDVFPVTSQIATNFDLFLTNDPGKVSAYQELGANCEALPIGTNPDHFRFVPPRTEYLCDVLMMGRMLPDRIAPVKELSKHFNVHVYGEGWASHGIRTRGLLYGEDSLAALSSARMALIFNKSPSGKEIVKVGLVNFTAAGALVLTNQFPGTQEYFDFGKEIVGFDSTEDLVEKVGHYLRNPEEAEKIRHAGRERTLRDHTWESIWRRILEGLDEVPTI